MLYTAKCFWPGVDGVRAPRGAHAAPEAVQRRSGFRGALYLPGDELVLCLFDCSLEAAVKSACERAGWPCERVIESVWIAGPKERENTE